MTKYQVMYLENRKVRKAVFYKIEDAGMWENHIKREKNVSNVEIIPLFQ